MKMGKGDIASKLNKLQETDIKAVPHFSKKLFFYFFRLTFYEFFDSAIRLLGFEKPRFCRIGQFG